MDRNSIVWILECCLLNLDNHTKKDMIRYGASEELAEMGIQLSSFLKNKEIILDIKNGN